MEHTTSFKSFPFHLCYLLVPLVFCHTFDATLKFPSIGIGSLLQFLGLLSCDESFAAHGKLPGTGKCEAFDSLLVVFLLQEAKTLEFPALRIALLVA